MSKPDLNRTLTPDEILGAIIGVVVIVVPMILVVAMPENRVVSAVFGGGRIVIFWIVLFGLVWVFRKKFDKFAASVARRRSDRKS